MRWSGNGRGYFGWTRSKKLGGIQLRLLNGILDLFLFLILATLSTVFVTLIEVGDSHFSDIDTGLTIRAEDVIIIIDCKARALVNATCLDHLIPCQM